MAGFTRMVVVLCAFAAASILMIGSAAGSLVTATSGHDVEGTVVLDDGFGTSGRPCSGSGRFADVVPGAKVEIRDDHKKLLATATLGPGIWTAAFTGSSFVYCEFSFLASVADAKSYRFKIGKQSSHKFSGKALAKANWRLEIQIG